MSWELASFLILGAVLLAGFAWYERSRPPSQVVALVAALAALAIVARIAFAAFPNVKPTTDIVVFSGYALGGAPGFAVGALTALVSNFWFGQGPWTPWQMAGWGICGMIGAGLAAIGGRNVGRLTLAAVCGLAAVVYGALLNFSLMATYGGDLSLKHFLVLESRAVPFDAAHTIGNVVFALIAGPAMIRMLTRFRGRFEWRPPALTASLLLLLAFASVALPARAGAASPSSARSWLVANQNSDGGWGSSPGDDSGPETTAWVMLGLEASGRNPLDVSRNGKTPVDYLRSQAAGLASAGDYARTILALEGAGLNPRSFGGRDLVSALLNRRRSDGSYAGREGSADGAPGVTSFAVMALRAAGATGSLDQSESWLRSVQNSDHGWGDEKGSESNADVTGTVMQAIPNTEAASKALSYLKKHQAGNGGYALDGGAVNTQSTAWAVQGMIAVGANPSSIKAGGSSPIDYLNGLQEGDGHFRYSSQSDQTPVWVTGEVLVAASGESFPVAVAPRAPSSPTVTATPAPAPQPTLPPVPIPGVTAAPASPSVGGSGGSGGSKGGSAHAGPLIPGTSAAPPIAGSGAITPPGVASEKPEQPSGGLVAAKPASDVEADPGDPASPWIPIGIGVAVGLLALALPLALGRRYAW
jgi:energy-coupling factor transport system substrate-specific component